MPRTAIQTFEELPVRDIDRSCTDRLCAALCILFTLLTFVGACLMLNLHNLYQINYPTDSENRTCGYELPQHPYLYFTRPQSNNNIHRICVSTCPKVGEPLLCAPTADVRCSDASIVFYQSEPQIDRLGGYCIPVDKTVATNVLTTFNLHWKWNFLRSYDVIRITLLIALLAGAVFMLFVQFLPRIAVWGSVALTGVACLALAIMLARDTSPSFQSSPILINVVIGGLIFLGLICLFYLYWMRTEIRMCSIFIDTAAKFLGKSPCVFTYVPVYILLSLGLIVLTVFEYLAFSSSNPLTRQAHDIYWQTSPWTPWNILTFIQLVWGIAFLRDSFNFNVSGNAVEWYFTHEATDCMLPPRRMFMLNYGSVALGSFLNGFLFLPELLYDLLTPEEKGPCGFLASPFHCFCGAMINLMQLIREDAYAYVNLTGAPYCTSASCCEYLCHRSEKLEGGRSANRVDIPLLQIFRLTAHLWLLALIVIIGYSIDKEQLLNADVSPKALLCIFAGGYFIVTYFVLTHSDSAEGLLITFLAEDFMAHENKQQISRIPQSLGEALREQEIHDRHGYSNL